MFPTHEDQEQNIHGFGKMDLRTEKLKKLNSDVELKEWAKDGTPAIGQDYPLWYKDRSLPPPSRIIVDAASAMICLSRDDMITSLRQLEVAYRDSEWLKAAKYKAKRRA